MSIRRRLLVWLLSGMLLAGLAITVLVFYQARSTANEMFDYQLKQIALALRDRAYLPGDLADTLQAAEGLDFVIQAWTPDGRLVYESHPQIQMPATGVEGFSDVRTQLGTWRVFATASQLSIQVAQHRLALRSRSTRRCARPSSSPCRSWAGSSGCSSGAGEGARAHRAGGDAPESLDPIDSRRCPKCSRSWER